MGRSPDSRTSSTATGAGTWDPVRDGWDPDDPDRPCWTCGFPPTGHYRDGSPRYGGHPHDSTVAVQHGDADRGAGPGLVEPIDYLVGDEPVPRTDRQHAEGTWCHDFVWRAGDTGWIADIIEEAWSRWLRVYPDETRRLEDAVPYLRLTPIPWCEFAMDWKYRDLELVTWVEDNEPWLDWHRGGRVGPEPEVPPPATFGHFHDPDRGICLDPWLADHARDGRPFADSLRHELAHAISLAGHDREWLSTCAIIGHRLGPDELDVVAASLRPRTGEPWFDPAPSVAAGRPTWTPS